MADREAFEAFMRDKWPDAPLDNLCSTRAWEAWQAAVAQTARDHHQNPTWCYGCNPDNCSGCGKGADPVMQTARECAEICDGMRARGTVAEHWAKDAAQAIRAKFKIKE